MSKAEIVLSATDKTREAFKSVLGSFDSLESKAKGALGGIAAGFGLVALKGTFDSIIGGAAALDDLAESTGSTVEKLSSLMPVAKLAGIDIKDVGSALNMLTRRLSGKGDEGDQGGKGAAAQLKELGLAARDAAGELKDPTDLLIEIAGSLDNYRDGMGKTQAAQELFGKSGAQLLPFLKDLAEFGELNARMTARQAAEAESYEKNIKRLTLLADAWKKEIALGILPAMTALSEAFLDQQRTAGGLSDKVNELKRDGSLEQWGRDGAMAIAFVVDSARDAVGAIGVLGSTLPVLASGAQLAWAKLSTSNMSTAARDVILNKIRREKEGAENLMRDAMDKFLDTPQLRTRLESAFARQDAARASGAGAAASKPALPGVAGSGAGRGAAAAQSDIEKLIQASRERTAVLEFEAGAENKVTDAQKRALTLMVDLRDGKLKGTEAERAALAVQLEAELAADRANEKRKIALEQLKEDARFRKEQYTSQVRQLESVEAEVEAARKSNAEIGLSREQLAALTLARIDDTISIRQRQLANEEATGQSASTVEALKEEIEKLRELRNLRIEGTAKQQIADTTKEAEEKWKRTSETIERSLTDALMRGFENGKDSAKNLRDTMENMFRTLVLKPIIEAQVAPIGKAISGALGGGGFGGLFEQITRGFGIGGQPNYGFTNEFGMADVGLGFAGGGSFMVGGSGGTDSQQVRFRASPNERVTIETPEQQRGGRGGAVSVVQNITFNGQSDRAFILASMARAKDAAVSAVIDSLNRGGPVAKATGKV